MKTFALLLSFLLLGTLACASVKAAEPVPAAKPDLAKGEAISTNVSVSCHSNDGTHGSPANPISQGQLPEYLV